MSNRKATREHDALSVIRSLLSESGEVSSGQVARALGVTRQAAHYHLARLLEDGEVRRLGRGRSARYESAASFARTYTLASLSESEVWKEVIEGVPPIAGASQNGRSILSYAFTEMLNNAIDHSHGSQVNVRVWVRADSVAFELVDDGIGVFRSVGRRMGLSTDLESLQEIEKGKATTAPERHSGEGIFFTSRAVDLYVLESGQLRWTVDNRRSDVAVADTDGRRGTRVRCELDLPTQRTLSGVFDPFTSNAEVPSFDRTSVRVGLYEIGDTFISRSEAKRLSSRLEGFAVVELDFSGVHEIGQGFADELFRVWASSHPDTSLVPVATSPAVQWMIERATRG